MKVLSGIQPTGSMHIGNYLGAVKYWTELQEKHDCFFTVVDLHALTVSQDPKTFSKQTLEKVVELISVGISPEQCTLFLQSHVKEHTELAWIFNTITPIAELERMTQYKDKSAKHKKNINAGLFTYPALMAADILLYRPDGIPVGKDQTQHLELTRLLVRKFNKQFGETFSEPDTLLPKEGAKIMSLQDPKQKMSKSDPEATYISLFDEPNVIQKKLMKSVTDTGNTVSYSPTKKPGVSNLLTIYSLFAEQSIEDTEKRFSGKGYADLKRETSDLLSDKLEPFRKKKKELLARDVYVKEMLKTGARKAQSVAAATMEDVRAKVGLLTT